MAYSYKSGDPPEGSWIPKADLVEGQWYKGECRNADEAQWKEDAFYYTRHKFGFSYIESIPHPEDDHGYDVFFPFQKIDKEMK